MKPLYTIGYEGRSIEELIAILHLNEVTQVIDVRRNPISRKPNFSKTALARNLAASNIEYAHVVELGTPDELRKALRSTEDYNQFFDGVQEYLDTQAHVLDAVLDMAFSQSCALLCFERNPNECHRISIAVQLVRLSDLEISVEHLGL